MSALSFDDPKPPRDTRVPKTIFIRPSLRDEIDDLRGRTSRSEWIEVAIRERLARLRKPGH